MWLLWLAGVLYTAPKFAARDAAMRGRSYVDGPSMFVGFARATVWWCAWAYPYVEKKANAELAKYPDVRHQRSLEIARKTEELEKALERGDAA